MDILTPFAAQLHTWDSQLFAIKLPASMDDYWATFSKKTRDRLKGKMRKFEREMQPQFRVTTTTENFDAVLADIEAVDRSRWGAATKFGDAGQRQFLRELIRRSVDAQLARVFTLYAQGKCVAYIVGFLAGDSLKVPYLAHDIELPGNYSVGLINNIMAIEHSISTGLREYDLTRGTEGYKAQLGGELHHNHNWLMYRSAFAKHRAQFNRVVLAPILKTAPVRALYRKIRG
jgi:CelD/BcsL family acetyltransferase involved in cellulose biosynthesis